MFALAHGVCCVFLCFLAASSSASPESDVLAMIQSKVDVKGHGSIDPSTIEDEAMKALEDLLLNKDVTDKVAAFLGNVDTMSSKLPEDLQEKLKPAIELSEKLEGTIKVFSKTPKFMKKPMVHKMLTMVDKKIDEALSQAPVAMIQSKVDIDPLTIEDEAMKALEDLLLNKDVTDKVAAFLGNVDTMSSKLPEDLQEKLKPAIELSEKLEGTIKVFSKTPKFMKKPMVHKMLTMVDKKIDEALSQAPVAMIQSKVDMDPATWAKKLHEGGVGAPKSKAVKDDRPADLTKRLSDVGNRAERQAQKEWMAYDAEQKILAAKKFYQDVEDFLVSEEGGHKVTLLLNSTDILYETLDTDMQEELQPAMKLLGIAKKANEKFQEANPLMKRVMAKAMLLKVRKQIHNLKPERERDDLLQDLIGELHL